MEIFTCKEKNLDATHALTKANEIKSICSILYPFGIRHFCYLRLFKDGSHLLLCTDPEWVKCFYLHHYARAPYHKNPKDYISGYQLWNTAADQSIINVAREQFNIAHGMALVEQNTEDCELFHFATTRENSAITNFYLNNLGILQHFTLFFKERAQTLIRKAHSDRLILPHWLTQSSENNNAIASTHASQLPEQDFWSATPVKRFTLNENPNHYLTLREMTCISWLARGFSSKEIAKKLDVSSRTVEAHFDNLRHRLKCHSKSELLARILRKWPHWFNKNQ